MEYKFQLSRQLALGVGIISFAVSTCIGVISLTAHTPFKSDLGGLAALTASQIQESTRGWRATHILLSQGCDCSRKLSQYLIKRGAHAGLQEHVVIVGSNPQLTYELSAVGFITKVASQETLAHEYNLHGVPLFLLQEPGGRIRYMGGYSADRRSQPEYQDLAIIRAFIHGEERQALPVYGCAIGNALRTRINPIEILYRHSRSDNDNY